jgi:hypothetical protein
MFMAFLLQPEFDPVNGVLDRQADAELWPTAAFFLKSS